MKSTHYSEGWESMKIDPEVEDILKERRSAR
jgi:hypothetical protein